MILEIVLLVVTGIVLHFLITRLREPPHMPPGPRPLPLVGNLLDVMSSMPYMHLAFCDLRRKYGDIFTVYLQGQRAVVINSAEIAREALLTKKDDFAGRPYVFTGDYVTRHSKDIVFGDYSERLKLLRKIGSKALRLFSPQVQDVVQTELNDLVERMNAYGSNPANLKNDIQLSIMNVICAMLFGQRYSVEDPEFLKCVYFTDTACRVGETTSILGLFPWLIHFPIQAVRDINKCCEIKDKILNRKYHEHLATLKEGKTGDLTHALLTAKLDEEKTDMKSDDVIEDDHVIMTMQDVFIAGNETITTTILWTLVHLVTHPKIQAKIHAQLDEVVGFDRKPELKDKENLPYVEAVLAETSRLSSVAPLSIPHKATKDTSLQGYTIPKDTVVFLNLWAIHHDEKQWKDPMEFVPERFLDSDGKMRETSKLSYMPFSAGRRVCLGKALARQEMFLFICGLLQQFEFKAPTEPFKEPAGKDGIVRTPLPFEVCMRKRNVDAA
ncbi:steroid 17-alpha-hydroxylase/17,20 lyase-like [Actinia tenebrosa]|uniref:Steroid 21-hydroxylase n=1 Tax=Actinia tenebrosa TaxID=6105 RepID=A0A6P8JCJ8_ACTTE|nr:steroid 17-alpha-hydroxylase/17,20 lyase-like [Actinia tenebrosa]XP_031574309.1 steroid 17-alpha-hydroxylase/17,20 lyase-like [Actinia tenebrosa]XP_031574310.1 steroid 17-alpha-hydroxylase/17,20 lyase-like [Actinia tenebrosa]XP_031574312.1 steroid 17-alpha-hydroxylase/17,20 lyase-like [Actinia tenebrosa]